MTMTITLTRPELFLRSTTNDWNAARWETLTDDGNRYEVIDGVLYMSSSPSGLHQWIIRQVVRILFAQIDDRGYGITIWSPIGVFMPGCDPVQPDILVIRSEDRAIYNSRRVDGVPTLMIEVLSPSNPEHDLVTKLAAYARASVPEYWTIAPHTQTVTVRSDPDPVAERYNHVATFTLTDMLYSPTFEFSAPVAAFFADPPPDPSGDA